MSSETIASITGSGSASIVTEASLPTLPPVIQMTPARGDAPPRERPGSEPEVSFLIPRPEPPLPKGHRRCPTLPGSIQPLVRQVIVTAACQSRQCESYHKCHQCIHRDRPQYRGAELPPLENSPARLAQTRLDAL